MCPWRAGESGDAGLYAQFVHPPVIDADSAFVELSTGCHDDGMAFMQVHRFGLNRDGTGGGVTRRELMWVT